MDAFEVALKESNDPAKSVEREGGRASEME
jgi:hypothetical protein